MCDRKNLFKVDRSNHDIDKKLVENPELRKSSGQACRKFAENHFNPEENAKILAQLLDGLADKKNVTVTI